MVNSLIIWLPIEINRCCKVDVITRTELVRGTAYQQNNAISVAQPEKIYHHSKH